MYGSGSAGNDRGVEAQSWAFWNFVLLGLRGNWRSLLQSAIYFLEGDDSEREMEYCQLVGTVASYYYWVSLI